MKVTVQLTPEDYLAARWVAMRPRPLLKYFLYGTLVFLLLYIGWDLSAPLRGGKTQGAIWGMITLMAYFAFLSFVALPWSVRKIYRQQKSLQRPYEVQFGDTDFTVTSADGSFALAWADVHKWKHGKKCLLIFHSDALMHIIPWRSVASEADRESILRLLEAKLGKAKF